MDAYRFTGTGNDVLVIEADSLAGALGLWMGLRAHEPTLVELLSRRPVVRPLLYPARPEGLGDTRPLA